MIVVNRSTAKKNFDSLWNNNLSLVLIELFTNLEFVGVVSLFGNGLLRAKAAQLQKIVSSTKYSKGLEENIWKKRNFLEEIPSYFHSTNFIHVRRNLLSSDKQNNARRGCSGVTWRRLRRRISACCKTVLHALLPVGISSKCA